ncbi:MAG: VacJ family lipoprotein [Rhodospirillales bacterium]|nr:VacJ family lipoprotein [Rhodospirillales bacterium]
MGIFMLASGCANLPDPADPEAVAVYMQVNDPIEPTNRSVFALNNNLDKAILKPVAEAYSDSIPNAARLGIHNALNNLRTPVILLNDVLQGNLNRSLMTFMRFVINSTVGMFGLVDAASELGMARHIEDFGQTLAVWGVPSGSYLMLLFFGPSNPRDAAGLVVDFLTDPINIWTSHAEQLEISLGRDGAHAINKRALNLELLNEVEKSSLDFYAAIRSLYKQRRGNEISNGIVNTLLQTSGLTNYPGLQELDDEELSRRK